ncbi:MAG: aldo/keto reductase [Erysipelotrichaceae bacterium]|nr:aldo/keto reductase [Erysipelotrichaceae bacterium]
MIYSEFKGLSLSRLGFGCMRFASDPATGEIDQARVNAMFDLAIEKGVNYFDTAYPYLGGKSEIAMAEALKKYPRESYYIADKFPGHSLPGPVDNIALFNLSLQKCRTEYFDFYLLHNITEWSVKIYESDEYHIIPDILKMKEEGKIRHLGFSFHGGPDLLEEFLTRHEGKFEFVQIQCNYLDWTLQDAKKKYDIITKHGLGVWIMEPCRGGKLAVLREEERAKLKKFSDTASDASYAFRFLQDLPNIKVILSGMNEISQVEDNLKTFETHVPLSEEERNTLFEIAEGMKKGVPCTACRYCCDGCPVQLNIPYLLSVYNDYKYAPSAVSGMRLDGLSENEMPSACIRCGQCTHACPQSIDVPKALAELADMYANGPHWADAAKPRHEDIRKALHMD